MLLAELLTTGTLNVTAPITILLEIHILNVQLNVHQLTVALMVVVRMQSAYVKELHLYVAVCLEQQAGLRLSAIQRAYVAVTMTVQMRKPA